MSKKIYLAGAMSGLTLEQMNDWRKCAKAYLEGYGFKCINPVEFYNTEIDTTVYTDKEIKEFDLWAVRNSEIVLVNLEYPNSIGTAIELHMAQEWKIPVVAFGRTQEKPVHPWMNLCITKECETMPEAINYILSFLAPIVF